MARPRPEQPPEMRKVRFVGFIFVSLEGWRKKRGWGSGWEVWVIFGLID